MLLKVFKSKIHRAQVTEANLNYEGSISLGPELIQAAGLNKYEAVWVWNINNGERLMTYVLEGSKPGEVCLNGAAARLCQVGDLIIITAFTDLTPNELTDFKPKVVLLEPGNIIKDVASFSGHEVIDPIDYKQDITKECKLSLEQFIILEEAFPLLYRCDAIEGYNDNIAVRCDKPAIAAFPTAEIGFWIYRCSLHPGPVENDYGDKAFELKQAQFIQKYFDQFEQLKKIRAWIKNAKLN